MIAFWYKCKFQCYSFSKQSIIISMVLMTSYFSMTNLRIACSIVQFSFSHCRKSIQGQICVILCAVVLVWYVRLAQHNIKPWEKDNEIIGFRLHFESFLCTETTWVKTEEWLWKSLEFFLNLPMCEEWL